jgi:hypothetical protein
MAHLLTAVYASSNVSTKPGQAQSELPVLAVGAALANLCFMAGPMADAYLSWLGLRSRWVTAGLFVCGLLVSIPLVYMFGFSYALMLS